MIYDDDQWCWSMVVTDDIDDDDSFAANLVSIQSPTATETAFGSEDSIKDDINAACDAVSAAAEEFAKIHG